MDSTLQAKLLHVLIANHPQNNMTSLIPLSRIHNASKMIEPAD